MAKRTNTQIEGEQPPKRGCLARVWRWFLYGIGIILVCGLIAGVIQIGGEALGMLPTRTPTPIPTITLTPSVTPIPSETPLPTDTPVSTDTPVVPDTPVPAAVDTATAPVAPASAPVDASQGIVFGEPLIVRQPGITLVILLVTNNSAQVKTFTAQATFKTGEQIVTVASGAVNDLLPGQTKAVTLLPMGEVPEVYDSVRVNVDTMVLERDQTDGGNAAQKIVFGLPVSVPSPGFNMINVEVTNTDSVAHTFTVQAALMRGGQLVGYANGAVNELAPGQVKTATLMVQGELTDTEIKLAVETMVQ